MQDKIGYMISAGIKTIELIIEHQGEPGQRMPEFGVGGAECPANSIRRNAGLDMTVFCDINIIIEIDEVKLIHLPVNSKRNKCQNDINHHYLFFRS